MLYSIQGVPVRVRQISSLFLGYIISAWYISVYLRLFGSSLVSSSSSSDHPVHVTHNHSKQSYFDEICSFGNTFCYSKRIVELHFLFDLFQQRKERHQVLNSIKCVQYDDAVSITFTTQKRQSEQKKSNLYDMLGYAPVKEIAVS